MENFLVRTRAVILTAYYQFIAFRNNLIVEFLDRRQETKKRRWTAKGTFGAGTVPLGKVNMNTAVEKTAKFGTVINVDIEFAIVFYAEKR